MNNNLRSVGSTLALTTMIAGATGCAATRGTGGNQTSEPKAMTQFYKPELRELEEVLSEGDSVTADVNPEDCSGVSFVAKTADSSDWYGVHVGDHLYRRPVDVSGRAVSVNAETSNGGRVNLIIVHNKLDPDSDTNRREFSLDAGYGGYSYFVEDNDGLPTIEGNIHYSGNTRQIIDRLFDAALKRSDSLEDGSYCINQLNLRVCPVRL